MGVIIILLVIFAVVGIILAFRMGKRSNSSDELVISFNVDTTTRSEVSRDDVREGSFEDDAWEGGFWDATDPKRLKAHLQIDYQDGNNSMTRRSVLVREFDNNLFGGVLIGYCELRNATRTFRFDRIGQCVDLETGELVENVRTYLNDLYAKSPERSTEVLAEDYSEVLKTIYFVAKADGQFRSEEKEIVAAYVRKLVRDERITSDMINELLAEIGVPSIQGFKIALGRVLKSGQVNPQMLASCCQEIVGTQTSVSPLEKEALEYISKKVSSLPAS